MKTDTKVLVLIIILTASLISNIYLVVNPVDNQNGSTNITDNTCDVIDIERGIESIKYDLSIDGINQMSFEYVVHNNSIVYKDWNENVTTYLEKDEFYNSTQPLTDEFTFNTTDVMMSLNQLIDKGDKEASCSEKDQYIGYTYFEFGMSTIYDIVILKEDGIVGLISVSDISGNPNFDTIEIRAVEGWFN